jgi:chromosome segregation ATPase
LSRAGGRASKLAATACQSCFSRQYPRIDRNEIESELTQLEEELERVTRLAEESDASLAALEAERVEREGRLQLARRAKDDFERRIEAKRVELQRAEAEALIQQLDRSIAHRDAAAELLASAVEAAIARLHEYKAEHEAVMNAWKTVRKQPTARKAVEPETARPAEHEPAAAAQSIKMLTDTVREHFESQLEPDLVEAAARSPMGYEIQKLPAHLQALARERRLAVFQERKDTAAALRDEGLRDSSTGLGS